ncbi:sentrin-specific protease 7 isoform X2 [Stegastes partitus]|nr:PREDICTED: sentrin-specific protease 7-like isoform X2 [Stegastes partitus]
MENPLRIPMTCLSSDCGKLERQVSWTAFAGCKFRHSNVRHKNGSTTFDDNHAAMITMEMTRRRPLLILTDVLKTEPGQAYIDRIKKSHMMSNRGLSTRRESVRNKEVPLTCRDTKTSQRETKNNKNKSETPKRNQKTTPTSSQRSKPMRGQQKNDEEEDNEESTDTEEVILGMNNGEDDKFAEVVDCGLSVSWEPTENKDGCDDFSPASVKDRWTDSEKDVQQNLKRRRKDSGSQCNGTGSPKRHRESVLRLTGEDGRNGGPVPSSVCQEQSEEDVDLENLDRCIVQFTVGGDDRTNILVPVISPSHDNTAQASPAEPIVLSSDDEESGVVSQAVRTLKDTVIQGQSSVKAVAKQQQQQRASHIQDMQVLQVDTGAVSSSVTNSVNYSCMGLTFSTLHCGGFQGKAKGGIMIAEDRIIIPLTDTSEQFAQILSFERKELRRYSVWEKQELEARKFHLHDDEENCPAVLLFCVSETAATALQQDLSQLCVNQDEAPDTGKASPFILLTLKGPLEGMEGALLRSLLDIDCLNSLANGQAIVSDNLDTLGGLDIDSPVLSLDDSIELIRRTGLDSHLLSMLGVKSTDPEPSKDKSSSQSDGDKTLITHTQQEAESLKGSELESELEPEMKLETKPEQDTGTQLKPKEDQKEQEPEHPSDKKKVEPTPAYTLCHRRTKGSYSVSLCKPDSSWTKYKHQGLARRLIQFPPPPLKGGISVTMEDLQCLDSGQYLNDVIIDFYLKYLIQDAPAAVAERSHIFSSFFYKQLTRRDNASEGASSDSCQRQRRHQRVKTWTRHVDIFKKDFLFVPVNQEAHWYLVVICFPGMDEPKLEDWAGSDSQKGKSHSGTSESLHQEESQGCKSLNESAETPPTLSRSDTVDKESENGQKESTKDPPPGPVNCTELTCKKKTVCKRPCILIMDSLKLSLHERVFKLLREYLQSEWEVRRGSSREFGPDQMKSSHCQVPLQDNSSDCGLYLLQYVECFLKDPVVHFDLPLHLQRWFPRQQVRRKRDEIRDLILSLHRRQNLDEA